MEYYKSNGCEVRKLFDHSFYDVTAPTNVYDATVSLSKLKKINEWYTSDVFFKKSFDLIDIGMSLSEKSLIREMSRKIFEHLTILYGDLFYFQKPFDNIIAHRISADYDIEISEEIIDGSVPILIPG